MHYLRLSLRAETYESYSISETKEPWIVYHRFCSSGYNCQVISLIADNDSQAPILLRCNSKLLKWLQEHKYLKEINSSNFDYTKMLYKPTHRACALRFGDPGFKIAFWPLSEFVSGNPWFNFLANL